MTRSAKKLLMSLTLTVLVFQPLASSFAAPPEVVSASLDELVERQLSEHPEAERARMRLRDRVLEREALEAQFAYRVSADLQGARSNTPTRQGITSGIVQSDRLSLETGVERNFDFGMVARLAWSQSIVRSEFPVSLDDFRTTIVNGPDYESALTLTLTQSLLRGRGREVQRASIVQAALRERSEAADVLRASLDRISELMAAWLEVVSASEEVAERERGVLRAERMAELTRRQVEAGRLAEVESQIAEQQILLAREAELMAHQAWEQASRTLLEKAGESGPGARRVIRPAAGWEPAPVLSAAAACERVQASSLELALLDARIREAESAAAAAREPLRPSLEASAMFSQRGIEESSWGAAAEMFKLQGSAIGAGLTFAWVPGNAAARREADRARLAVEMVRHERDTLAQSLCRQVDSLYMELELIDEREELAAARVELAERALTAEERRLELGVSTVQATLDLAARVDDAALGVLRLEQQRRGVNLQIARLTGELALRFLLEPSQ